MNYFWPALGRINAKKPTPKLPSFGTSHLLTMIKSIYILNRSGGLVYQRDFSDSLNKLDSNDYLVLASTIHSVHALATSISPLVGSSGIKTIEAPGVFIHCHQSLTGIKFLVITDRSQSNVPAVLNQVHVIYSDYVAKNPFYSLEMPIRSQKFDEQLSEYVAMV